jgi:hypothetical protein
MPMAGRRAGRVVAGDGQEDEEGGDLLGGEHLLAHLAVHSAEVRSSVGFLRRSSASSHEPMRGERHEPSRAVTMSVWPPIMSGSPAAEDGVGGVEHRVELAARDAHHVADHQERERLGERLDEVDLALLAHVVDDLGADRLDRVEHSLQARGVNERATMPRWRAWRGSSIVMKDPKNSMRLGRHVGDRDGALARAVVQRVRRLISIELGVAGDGEELVGHARQGIVAQRVLTQ